MKHPFLVVYDYGTGGVWAVVNARSKTDIERRFPELKIMDEPPEWMSKEELAEIQQTMAFDADRPEGWLAKVASGGKPSGKDAAAG